MHHQVVALLALVALPIPARGAESSSASPAAIVAQVGESYYAWLVEESLDLRKRLGLPIEHLPSLSPEKEAADAERARQLRARLDTVDAVALPHDDLLSLEILRFLLDGIVEAPAYRRFAFSVMPYSSPLPRMMRVFQEWTFADDAAVLAYERLLGELADRIGEVRAQIDLQANDGVRIPLPALDPIVGMLRAFGAAPPASPLSVAELRLAALAAPVRTTARERIDRAVATRIAPAFAEVAALLDGPYRAAAPAGVGLAQYPGGLDYYRWLIRRYTSLELAPEEIHALGHAELAKLDAAAEAIRVELGFSGTVAELRAALRKDPRFYDATPEAVGRRLMAPVERIAAAVPRFFLRTPKAPYGVRRLDPSLEATQTFGYYEPPSPADPIGIYYYNASRLEDRPQLWSAGLIAHELVPGHHFQIALQQEHPTLPPFRKEAWDTAYVEGWAEYAAELAGEMGGYPEPTDRFGRILAASFIATRLVVDTGMNALGWSRDRALAFMAEHTVQSETERLSETLRYSTDIPAQALAYRLGHLKIAELRARAEGALGSRFDIRRFHEAVLAPGSMPLAVLARHVDWWIAEEQQQR